MSEVLNASWREGRVLACRADGALYHRIELEIAGYGEAEPGQFCLLSPGPVGAGSDPLLLRPLSLLHAGARQAHFLIKVCGRGSVALAALAPGQSLRCLGPLGRPFTRTAAPVPFLVGGGVGIPPLCWLSRALSAQGIAHHVLFGFGTEADIPLDSLAELAAQVEICTLDGSRGFHGNPVQALDRERVPGRIQACGPEAMLRALVRARGALDLLELSLEERMACGVGACRGCVTPVRDHVSPTGWRYATVCREGPVFPADRLCEHSPVGGAAPLAPEGEPSGKGSA